MTQTRHFLMYMACAPLRPPSWCADNLKFHGPASALAFACAFRPHSISFQPLLPQGWVKSNIMAGKPVITAMRLQVSVCVCVVFVSRETSSCQPWCVCLSPLSSSCNTQRALEIVASHSPFCAPPPPPPLCFPGGRAGPCS
jgi:hypothetical protein